MRVVFTGGGTGGHIFPAIAIALGLKSINPEVDILFIGAKGKLEEKVVPNYNFQINTIKIYGFNKKQILKTLILPFVFFSAVFKCKNILKTFKADIVVGTGAFVSAPVFYSAAKLKIPFVIQEGNAYPGKVTKFFSDNANKVIINFEETKDFLKSKSNVLKIAHPIREYKYNINKDDIIKRLDINPKHKTLFIFGGSQGSVSINKAILKSIEDLYNLNINIIWQTGEKDFERVRKSIEIYADRIKIFKFIHAIDEIYSISDLVICRGGITSIMEISAFGKPAIIIPYPFAAENHQEKNARALEKEDACIVIKDEELENKLYPIVKELINDSERLNKMSVNVRKFADVDAAKKIASEIIKIVKNGRKSF